MPYMNPFDFVPFHHIPITKTFNEWLNIDKGELISGKIKVQLKTITPLNVTGEIEARKERIRGQNRDISYMTIRKFYRRKNESGEILPCVPGSSIKGMIRSYIEALTNGFVSSYNIEYRKVYKERHIGFLTASYPPDLSNEELVVLNKGKRKSFEFKNVLPQQFKIPERIRIEEDKIDVASFLFGITALPVDKEEAGALRGRIRFSDVFLKEDSLTKDRNHPKALDLKGDASFGAPNPSISNWWYFTPGEIRLRKTNIRGRLRDFAEFVGNELRGRKFYFHQEPTQCVQWYKSNWTHMNNLVRYDVECVKSGEVSQPFYITFHKVPQTLLKLFLTALCPSRTVRHKLGALKPFGFGSVEFIVNEVAIEKNGWEILDNFDLNGGEIWQVDKELIKEWTERGQDRNNPNGEPKAREEELSEMGLVGSKSWEWLRFILHCPQNLNNNNRLFVYPPYNQRATSPQDKGFAQTIEVKGNSFQTGVQTVTIPYKSNLLQVATELYNNRKKLPIDFHIYQVKAQNFNNVKNDAGLPNFLHAI